jgi:hypothetical protein
MPGFDYVYEVGSWRERSYWIGVRADPALHDVRSFAVVLFFERVERKDFDVDVDSVFEAEGLLAENWRRYARVHERNDE